MWIMGGLEIWSNQIILALHLEDLIDVLTLRTYLCATSFMHLIFICDLLMEKIIQNILLSVIFSFYCLVWQNIFHNKMC